MIVIGCRFCSDEAVYCRCKQDHRRGQTATSMSGREQVMPDSNDSFDLPRWSTQLDPLPTSVHTSSSQPYPYSAPPPGSSLSATSPNRLPSTHHSPTGPSRPPRISQILDQNHQLSVNTSQYLSSGNTQLARSASLSSGPSPNSPSARNRRHQHDDLEGAFGADNQQMTGQRQQPHPHAQNSYYSGPVAYQPQSLTAGATSSTNAPPAASADSYPDMYFTSSVAHPPKRTQTTHETSSVRGGRSPMRGPATPNSNSLLDSYSQQAQYSPTTSANYPYGPPQDRSHPPPPAYQSHNRTHSQIKSESMTPPLNSAYNPSSAMHVSPYSSPYAMDTGTSITGTTSPHTSSQTHLGIMQVRQNSTSNPPTPASYPHPPQSSSQYYPQDPSMLVDPPQKRRASGFRRVRTLHDLQPRADVPFAGRRMGSDGTYLSVCIFFHIFLSNKFLISPAAFETVDDEHH